MNLVSIQSKLGLVFTGYVLLIAVSTGGMLWSLGAQKQDGLVINLAGRQRMLVQQMVSLALQNAIGGSVAAGQLGETAEAFEQTLRALRFGGPAPYLRGEVVHLQASGDSMVQAQLAEVAAQWETFSRAVGEALQGAPGTAESRAAAETIQRLAPDLTSEADAVVRLYEAEAEEKNIRLQLFQAAFLLAALVLIILGSQVIARSVTRPLEKLGVAAAKIGEGDLGTPIHVAGPLEIERLSKVLEDMRQELKANQDEFIQWGEQLEKRVAQRTKELEALNQVSSEIASRLDLTQVLRSIAEKTSQLLNAEAVFLCLLNEDGKELRLQSSLGPPEAVAALATSVLSPPAIRVLSAEQAANCRECGCLGECQIIQPRYRTSHLAAPLRTGEHILGALCVGGQAEAAFGPDAPQLLTRLANIAAIAIMNARLFSQAEVAASLQERQRMAAEMHDGLAQTLSYLMLETDQISGWVEAGAKDAAVSGLDKLRAGLDRALIDTRRAIASLQETGPVRETLQDQLKALSEEFGASYDMEVRWMNGLAAPVLIERPQAEQVLRTAGEALQNAAKHSQARHVILDLKEEGDCLALTIQDDGCGFDPQAPLEGAKQDHFGIKIMRARAARLGGWLDICSSPGKGARVTVRWPKETGNGADQDLVG